MFNASFRADIPAYPAVFHRIGQRSFAQIGSGLPGQKG
jgi:hypothetical protein